LTAPALFGGCWVGSMGVVGQGRFTAPLLWAVPPTFPPFLIRSSRLVTRFRMLCCSVPCRPCVCAPCNSCAGLRPTVRTGFRIDGQAGWKKGGSSEWDWAPVRDHSSLTILIPYAISAPRGPSHSSVSSPRTHTIKKGCSGTRSSDPEASPLATGRLGLEGMRRARRLCLCSPAYRPPEHGPREVIGAYFLRSTAGPF
jgi:hypothetical protein